MAYTSVWAKTDRVPDQLNPVIRCCAPAMLTSAGNHATFAAV